MYVPIPYNEDFLPEVDGHRVYYAEYGNPNGPAIVFLHGGPGAHSKPKHADRFDLGVYRVIVFDQRGAGKSEPAGKLEHNTTQDLIADIERIRETLDVERWFVAGGSWGSTLALLYTEAYPERVRGLLLSAIFLADKAAWEWMSTTPDGAGQVYSDLWKWREEIFQKYNATLDSAAQIFYDRLTAASLEDAKVITADYLNWEKNLLIAGNVSLLNAADVTEKDIVYTKIFLHYESNNCFIEEGQIIRDIDAIKDIPSVLVHGRQDMVCPFDQAWRLHKALPESKLVVLPQSNHAFTPDGEIAQRLAFDSFLRDHSEA